jgi:hypothetical protein
LSNTFNVIALGVASTASVDITGSFGGTSQKATLTVTALPLNADFNVTPDPGTPANAGQCAVTDSGDPVNRNLLQCTFDGSASTSPTGISSYSWTLPGLSTAVTLSAATLKDPKVGCGGGLNGIGNLNVTLKITAVGGSTASKTKAVPFTKAGPC